MQRHLRLRRQRHEKVPDHVALQIPDSGGREGRRDDSHPTSTEVYGHHRKGFIHRHEGLRHHQLGLLQQALQVALLKALGQAPNLVHEGIEGVDLAHAVAVAGGRLELGVILLPGAL